MGVKESRGWHLTSNLGAKLADVSAREGLGKHAGPEVLNLDARSVDELVDPLGIDRETLVVEDQGGIGARKSLGVNLQRSP